MTLRERGGILTGVERRTADLELFGSVGRQPEEWAEGVFGELCTRWGAQ